MFIFGAAFIQGWRLFKGAVKLVRGVLWIVAAVRGGLGGKSGLGVTVRPAHSLNTRRAAHSGVGGSKVSKVSIGISIDWYSRERSILKLRCIYSVHNSLYIIVQTPLLLLCSSSLCPSPTSPAMLWVVAGVHVQDMTQSAAHGWLHKGRVKEKVSFSTN